MGSMGMGTRIFDNGICSGGLLSWIRSFSRTTSSSSSLPLESQSVASSASVDVSNASIFAEPGDAWWDPAGAMGPLHAMGPLRNTFIVSSLSGFIRDAQTPVENENGRMRPLLGLSHVDVGCGGGLLVEAMARLGAKSVGVDLAQRTVDAAKAHASRDAELASRGNLPEYVVSSVEALSADAAHAGQYDVVTSLEVVEHVTDRHGFLKSLGALAKPKQGHIVLSTINRTPRSYAIAIVGAEHVARIVPVGTHSWDQFVTPDELTEAVCDAIPGARLASLKGMWLNPLRGMWEITSDTAVNYIAHFTLQ